MQTRYVARALEPEVRSALARAPAVAILGPRQCGKSTLAHRIVAARRGALYLDLEKPSDRARLAEPELFLSRYQDRLVCLDEVQRTPEIFAVLRSLIDARRRPGRFLVLGSASRDLIRQSSESLAGRIAHLELTPFRADEAGAHAGRLWLRGGFPQSLLARSEAASVAWRRDFVRTFLERDLPQLGVRIPAATLSRFWKMCAHYHGQPLNQSQLGASLGVSHVTVRGYLELLAATFMIRLLPPLLPNVRKRLVKSPRVYVRDPGILHSLLEIDSADELLGHPVRGPSWEGWVIENAIAAFAGWRSHFYRAATGAELDLVLEKGAARIAVECKASAAPSVGPSFWSAIQDLGVREAWVIAPVEEGYPIGKHARVAPLLELMRRAKRKQRTAAPPR